MRSPFPAASLRARASECEDHRWPAGDGVRNRSAAHFQFHHIRAPLSANGVGSLTDSSPAGSRRSNLCRFLTGWSFPVRFHSAPTVCQDTSRRTVEQSFQVHSLSAGSTGLAALLDGHQQSRRKIANVRKAFGEIRNVER